MSELASFPEEDGPRKLKPPPFRQSAPNTSAAPATGREAQESAAESVAATPPAPTSKPEPKTPLGKYSLLGMADEIEARAMAATPLLGKFVLLGQATMIYAAPNTGKTLFVLKLCLDAIDAGRIAPANLYYVNADDSSGGLATKLRLLQDVGAHMLAPGLQGLKKEHLVEILTKMIDEGSARGAFVIIDTLKKFADLMDKKRSTEVAQVCRQFVTAGGTVLALGHTAKNNNNDGTPRYQGTTDILEDFDAVYVGEPMKSKADSDVRGAKFTRLKCRADCPEVVAYAYAAAPGISYAEKLASVQRVDPDDLGDYATEREDISEGPILQEIVQLIEAGCTDGKMALAKLVAKACGVSQRAVIGVLDRYTGNTPKEHLWNFETGPHNKRFYRFIDQTKRDS